MHCVIKGHEIVVYGATSTWGSMDLVLERGGGGGSMDAVHILMDMVQRGGPCFVLFLSLLSVALF